MGESWKSLVRHVPIGGDTQKHAPQSQFDGEAKVGTTSSRRGLRLIAFVASMAVVSLVLAACSNTPASSAATPGVTNNQITIGATVPLTGPAAAGYSEIAPAMNAVFQWKNAHGGVFGRTINYLYKDDGYNPSNTASITRQLVLQNKIFADVGSLGTPTQLAVQSYLNSQKVPQLFIESGCNCWSQFN